ncbi:MAG: hypothetical protein SNJ71_00830 [Bacteroidales bacterium]
MSKGKILEKAKSNRTRPAEIDGEPIKVRVYSGKELQKIMEAVSSGKDADIANILSEQFLDESGEKIFTPEFFLSDECPNVFIVELAEIFRDVNLGVYKKK